MAHKTKLFGLPVSESIPGAIRQSDGSILGTLDQIAAAYRLMNYQVPNYLEVLNSPIEGAKPYQIEGVNWLHTHLRLEFGALLADEMGLGKTFQSIRAWQALGYPRLLIVCPASVRRGWLRELNRWCNNIDAKGRPMTGDGPQRNARPILIESTKAWSRVTKEHNVVITSYQLAQEIFNQSQYFNMIIIDEIQNLKGRTTKYSIGLRKLVKQITYKLGLTGTPLWSYPVELWSVLSLLFPDYRFGTADQFDYRYCGAYVNKYGGKVNKGSANLDELNLRLKYVMLRRMKKDVARDLPAIIKEIVPIEANKLATEKTNFAIRGVISTYEAIEATLESKIDACVELAIASAEPQLIATWRKEDAYEIQRRIEKETKIKPHMITGELSQKQRTLLIEQAKTDKRHMVVTKDSVGVGVDGLQHSYSNMIVHALDYVPINTSQLIARLHRIGQTQPINIKFLVLENSIDEMIIEKIVDKLDIWGKLFEKSDLADTFDSVQSSTDDDILKMLYEGYGEIENGNTLCNAWE